jgi:hypothetical protein
VIRTSRFALLSRLSPFGLCIPLAVTACGSSGSTAASPGKVSSPPAKTECSADWATECTRQSCDPKDAAWSDCKINGWTSYVAAPHCDASSGQAGDDQALCAPSADDGIQLHFGPADYDDPAEVAKYTLTPGGESFDCTFDKTPDVTGRFLGQYIERSRPGAHHVQLTYAADLAVQAKTSRVCNLGTDLIATAGTFMAIAQSSALDVPDLSIPKPKDAEDAGGLDFEGSANPMDPDRMLQILSHYLNTTDQPILKEAWFNLYYRDPSEVRSALYTISLLGSGISVPPHSTTNVRRSCSTDVDRDVKYLQGHSHVGNQRFSIWHADAGTTGAKVYESYDPLEPANLGYSSLVTNRAPDPTTKVAGGVSGPLLLKAGDSLVWECQFDNQTDNTVGDGDPNPAFFGQMCYTYGAFAVPLGQTAANWACGAPNPSTL